MPVIKDIKDFDRSSGNRLERLIFNHRHLMIIACLIVTLILGYQTTKLTLNASYEKMLPQSSQYIKNYLDNKSKLLGLGNTVRIAVETTQGDIFDARYLETLKQINDEVYLTPGVDRTWQKSLWMPSVRWHAVTEQGFEAGPIMNDGYDGSPESLKQVRLNVARASIVGTLVADNFKSSIILVSLMEKEPATGKRLDYSEFSSRLEKIRDKYEKASGGRVKIHITGFAKIVGDLIDGLMQVMIFFVFAIIIAGIIIFIFTRCIRSTVLLICCSALAVLWQLGIITTLGFELDPYSILVPFLVFAIAVSHGTQKMNGIMQDIGRGTHKLVAARYTFRRLFLPGLTALSAAAVGFAVLMRIDIPVIRDLALTASVGVFVVIFTNLILLPVLLSYVGVSLKAAARSLVQESEEMEGRKAGAVWNFLNRFGTDRKWAVGAVVVLVVLAVTGSIIGVEVKIGDLDPGAPELRPNSRYNKDNAFLNANYGLSSDQFAVIVKTPPEGCLKYESLIEVSRLVDTLNGIPGVQAIMALPDSTRALISASYEGNTKWFTLTRNQAELNYGVQFSRESNNDLFNHEATVMPVIAYLSDHKADTLTRVVNANRCVCQHSQYKGSSVSSGGG